MNKYILWWFNFYKNPEISYKRIPKKEILWISILGILLAFLGSFLYELLNLYNDYYMHIYRNYHIYIIFLLSILFIFCLIYWYILSFFMLAKPRNLTLKIFFQIIKFFILISPASILIYIITIISDLDLFVLYSLLSFILILYVKIVFIPIYKYIISYKLK